MADKLSGKAKQVLTETMKGLVAREEPELSQFVARHSARVPAQAREWLDDLLGRVDTYRDGALVLLGFVVANESVMDVTVPIAGRRTVGAQNAELLERLQIACRKDPFQTIA